MQARRTSPRSKSSGNLQSKCLGIIGLIDMRNGLITSNAVLETAFCQTLLDPVAIEQKAFSTGVTLITIYSVVE